MKKLFTLLTLLLGLGCSAVWGQTTLFSTDFVNDWSNATLVSNDEATLLTPTYPKELFVRAKSSNRTVSVTDNGLTFSSNLSVNNHIAGIKLTGINGEINVSISHKYSNKKPTFRYYFVSGATEFSSSVSASYSTSTAPASNGGNSTIHIENISNTSGVLYIGAASSSYYSIAGITISTPAPEKEIVSQSLTGVKVNGSEIAASTKYGIEGTTITLTDSYVSAPTVAIINHITYNDNSEENKDVTVTLGAANATYDGFFSGTATIGETTYTVKVPVDVTPTLEATVSSITVSSPKAATGSQTFNVTGINLTGSTVNLALGSAIEGLSLSLSSIDIVNGAVNQEVTVSYKSNANVDATSVNLTISSTGVSDIIIPVCYSSTAAITTIVPVSTSTTWDWTNTGQSSNVASPDENNMVVFANTDGWGTPFNANAIAGKAKQFYASKSTYKYCQGHALKIITTVPGYVSIYFSNTGTKSEYRWLAVNGIVTAYKSKNEDLVEAVDIHVDAGEVLIEAIMGTSASTAPEYSAANTMFNFRKIVFTPEPSAPEIYGETVTITTTANMAGWRAFYDADNSYTVDENTTVYIATAKDESSVTLTSIADIPSATPVILKTSANDFTMTLTKADATSSTTGNLLQASTSGQNLSGGNIYRLGYGDDGIGFYPWSTTSATAGIVYINTGDGARSLRMVFADESTGIGAMLNDAIINSNVYDLQGRRVAQPQRGLYIMNGHKVVVK